MPLPLSKITKLPFCKVKVGASNFWNWASGFALYSYRQHKCDSTLKWAWIDIWTSFGTYTYWAFSDKIFENISSMQELKKLGFEDFPFCYHLTEAQVLTAPSRGTLRIIHRAPKFVSGLVEFLTGTYKHKSGPVQCAFLKSGLLELGL